MEKPKRESPIEFNVPIPVDQIIKRLKNLSGNFDCLFIELGLSYWQFTLQKWDRKPSERYSSVIARLVGHIKAIDDHATQIIIYKFTSKSFPYVLIGSYYYQSVQVRHELLGVVRRVLASEEIILDEDSKEIIDLKAFQIPPKFYFMTVLPLKACVEMLEDLETQVQGVTVTVDFVDDFSCDFKLQSIVQGGNTVSISGKLNDLPDNYTEILVYQDVRPVGFERFVMFFLPLLCFVFLGFLIHPLISLLFSVIAGVFVILWDIRSGNYQHELIFLVGDMFDGYIVKNKRDKENAKM